MSATDRFLHFFINNQLLLIEVLFAVIIGICVIWLFSNLHSESRDVNSEKQLKDIEKTLEKVLSATKPPQFQVQAAGVTEPAAGVAKPATGTTPASPAPTAVGAAAPSAEQKAELDKLKLESEAKTQKLAELEKALTLAKEELTKAQGQAAAGGSTEEFSKKIKDLESRLSEYEIIEDDIANLSLYKEENTRLKNELQKLKITPEAKNEAPAVVTTPATAPVVAQAATPAPVKPEPKAEAPSPVDKEIDTEKLVAEVADLAAQPIPASNPTPAAAGEDGGDKLIEEFESFMKEASKT